MCIHHTFEVDYPSAMKARLLAAKVRGDMKALTVASNLVSQEDLTTKLNRLSPYRMAVTDSDGNQSMPDFLAAEPILSEIDEGIYARLAWTAEIFLENFLLPMLEQGESQVGARVRARVVYNLTATSVGGDRFLRICSHVSDVVCSGVGLFCAAMCTCCGT